MTTCHACESFLTDPDMRTTTVAAIAAAMVDHPEHFKDTCEHCLEYIQKFAEAVSGVAELIPFHPDRLGLEHDVPDPEQQH